METWKKWTIWGGLYGLISLIFGYYLIVASSEAVNYREAEQYQLIHAILFFPSFLPGYAGGVFGMIIFPIPIGALIGYIIGDYLEHTRK